MVSLWSIRGGMTKANNYRHTDSTNGTAELVSASQ